MSILHRGPAQEKRCNNQRTVMERKCACATSALTSCTFFRSIGGSTSYQGRTKQRIDVCNTTEEADLNSTPLSSAPRLASAPRIASALLVIVASFIEGTIELALLSCRCMGVHKRSTKGKVEKAYPAPFGCSLLRPAHNHLSLP